jgi:hypothetical protein
MTKIPLRTKCIASTLLFTIGFQIIAPSAAYALTSGPAQEEFASFEPATTTDMVETYTGDFTYNIPLLSIPGPNGGYPINLAYHSGVGMEQEASWVGLGWALNVGAISRNLRGLPDDFNGDIISKTQHIKDNWTASLDIPTGYKEVAGFPPSGESGASGQFQIYYNNYKGLGTRYSFCATGSGESASLGLQVTHDSQEGMGIGMNFSAKTSFAGGNELGLGLNYTSRQGLQSFNFSSSVPYTQLKSSVSYATSFAVPSVSMQTTSATTPFTLRVKDADYWFKFQSNSPLHGSVYVSSVANDGNTSIPSEGYLNTSGASSRLKDFSRQEMMYSKKLPHLPSSNFTYDLYTQTGQGTGGMFRPHLNTFGVLTDPLRTSVDRIGGTGFELGINQQEGIVNSGNILTNIHVGVDFERGEGQNTSGPWQTTGDLPDWNAFTGLGDLMEWRSANDNIDYEPYYFQVIGEKTGHHVSDDQLNSLANDQAIRIKLAKEKSDPSWLNRHFKATNELVTSETGPVVATLNGTNQTKQKSTNKRARRSTAIETLNTAEAEVHGYSKDITNKDFSKPAGHLSEISMLQPDGMRYVYGMPAYNNKQTESTFAVSDAATPNLAVVSVPQNSGALDVSGIGNEYISTTKLPQYAHSWLLTTVLSADYLDVTNDGPTEDDFGYWVKFNYEKVYSNYKWRIPYSGAAFMDCYKEHPDDNKANYLYGEKEVLVLSSVETKTHIAVFETSKRQDACEAQNELDGGRAATSSDPSSLKKLDRIKLYTKKEFAASSPVPTKVINFEYSYDLCPNVPNNNGAAVYKNDDPHNPNLNSSKGKLTLKKLYFTYKNSTRGAFSPYVFDYGTENPAYNKLNMDRWGNYKNNDAHVIYPYVDHPYTSQAGSTPSNAWTLEKIFLPTGGTLTMDYESDDYAYVENKQAMRMFDICYMDKPGASPPLPGVLEAGSNREGSVNHSCEESSSGGGRNRIWFKMDLTIDETLTNLGLNPSSMTTVEKNLWFKKLYIDNLPAQQIYFRIYSDLKGGTQDYVKGYAEYDPAFECGFISDEEPINPQNYGYFCVKNKELASPVNTLGLWVSPFTRAGLEHLRASRSELIYSSIPYGTSGSAEAQIANLLTSFLGNTTDLMAFTIGFNNYAYQLDWGKNISLNGYSTVRLCEPSYSKKGGGSRVRSITFNDNWRNNPSISETSIYGQTYDYTKQVKLGETDVTISSGVAYEPKVGGEESPLKTAIPYENSILLHGSYNLFLETPILDNYYPGESVGYSQVTMRSIAPEQAADAGVNLQYASAPLTIFEFYTPKDFPVICNKTDMNPGQPIRVPIVIPGLYTASTNRQAKSQGYSIILNDMPGKPKAVTTKTRTGDQVISRQEFIYNTEDVYNENTVNRLSSKVQTLEINKTTYQPEYITSIVGQTHDMFVDMNEDSQTMSSFGMNFNLDLHLELSSASPYLITLIPLIMPIPTVKEDDNSLRTIVCHKIIQRSGILKKSILTTNGSVISTENLAYDIETGEPLLTKITNEFKDPIYNFSYPGHWYYPNLGGAYQNSKLTIDPPGLTSLPSGSDHYINLSSPSSLLPTGKVSDYFAKGDLVLVKCQTATNSGEYHVLGLDDVNKKILLINSVGQLFPVAQNVYSIRVLKSGFKNMQNVTVGDVTFKRLHSTDPADVFKSYDPQNDIGTAKTSLTPFEVENATENKIINSSAIEYNDDWQVFCGPAVTPTSTVICEPPPDILQEYLQMIQTIYSFNPALFSNTTTDNILLYDELTNSYYNGFTSTLLSSNPYLSSAVAASGNTQILLEIDPMGADLSITFHTPGVTSGCRYYFHSPNNNNIWTSLNAYSNWLFISWVSTNSIGISNYGTVTFQGELNNGSFATIELVVPNINPANCQELITQNFCCWDFSTDCYTQTTPNYGCGIPLESPINPYWAGMKGMWRPTGTYAYNSNRTQAEDVRNDGTFTDYARFPWEDPASKDDKWIKAQTITKYSPYGFEIENKDALENYSSALYGYNQSMVVAVGQNAQYNELAFDNFEDYPLGCNDKHFKFENNLSDITTDYAHTGKYSIRIPGLSSAATVPSLSDESSCVFTPINDDVEHMAPVTGTNYAHLTNCGDCLGKFEPSPNSKYVASVWVKEVVASSAPALIGPVQYSYSQMKITITGSSPVTYTFSPEGNVIDGWQRIHETFEIPAGATGITVELVNSHTSSTRFSYFDDIRLHPFDANMVSYVYNPVTLKTEAELDANNFATIYVYDDEGHLTQVKKETEHGIKTIKESRINSKRNNE